MDELDRREIGQVLLHIGRDQRENHHADLRSEKRRVRHIRRSTRCDNVGILVWLEMEFVPRRVQERLEILI